MSKSFRIKVSPATLRRLARWAFVFALLVALAWLGSWLLQRSLRTGPKKRAMQSWLDDTLNADVSILGDLDVRVNLIRDSWLVLNGVEVEHPNPVFSGKFITLERIRGLAEPLMVVGLMADSLLFQIDRLRVAIEEGEDGEWSSDGIMNPLAPANTTFPFPVPRFSDWAAELRESSLTLKRRGYQIGGTFDLDISGSPSSDRIVLRTQGLPFSLTGPDENQKIDGRLGQTLFTARLGEPRGGMPHPVPGRCQTRVESLPLASLPFFLPGIPLENAPGRFRGLVSYQESPAADGVLAIEGELAEVPLGIFGLPPGSPIRMQWPVAPRDAEQRGGIHIGPSGFGAFEMTIPLTQAGAPRQLSMRGDVAILDSLPAVFTRYSQWPQWLTRTFPAVEWRAGEWRAFGWAGNNLQLNLTRSTTGLNLMGEAEMMRGRVRIALTPDQEDAPVTIAAERLDAQLMALKLSQMLPGAFKVRLSGAHVNMTWLGYHAGDGGMRDWLLNMVFAKPQIDLSASGAWWRGLTGSADAIAGALPDWGGGDDTELREISQKTEMRLDQLALVSEKSAETLAVEFRAYGDAFGQITGVIEAQPDGTVSGEYLLAGESLMIDAVKKVNPDLAIALDLLANDSLGLRIGFSIAPDADPEFSYPFLKDARRVHDDLLREAFGGQNDEP